MLSEPHDYLWTERHRSPGLPRLWRLKLPLVHGFAHRERADLEIETSPTDGEQFANSQPRERDESCHRAVRFVELLQELCEILGGEECRLCLPESRSWGSAVSWT